MIDVVIIVRPLITPNNQTGKPPALPGDSERFDRVRQ